MEKNTMLKMAEGEYHIMKIKITINIYVRYISTLFPSQMFLRPFHPHPHPHPHHCHHCPLHLHSQTTLGLQHRGEWRSSTYPVCSGLCKPKNNHNTKFTIIDQVNGYQTSWKIPLHIIPFKTFQYLLQTSKHAAYSIELFFLLESYGDKG